MAKTDQRTGAGFVTVPQANHAFLVERVTERARADTENAIATYQHQLEIQSQERLEVARWCAVASVGIQTLSVTTTTTIAVALPQAKALHERLLTGGIIGIILGAIASVSFIHYAFKKIRT
ncbi:MAG TPA: hypothetical protein V6D27_10720 [Vampirovibrionales bacterium]|uniref:hypothetical protein n=1 Tax=Laspinema sp. D2d TaxID=2953686 RepID=UPI0021BAA5EA|nr:hypothetical protein [Laspinema sp. D2d]MCT7984987.1 hypothetical protein [Laspinema sp. D2d]